MERHQAIPVYSPKRRWYREVVSSTQLCERFALVLLLLVVVVVMIVDELRYDHVLSDS